MVPQINMKDPISSQILQPTNQKISMQTAVFHNKICNKPCFDKIEIV